jgi:hypothetical protein
MEKWFTPPALTFEEIMNISNLILAAEVGAKDAALIIGKVDFFVQAAETAANNTTLTGSQKLTAVKNALVADLKVVRPDLAAKIDAMWPEINAIINGLVALYNALSVLGFALKAAAAVA